MGECPVIGSGSPNSSVYNDVLYPTTAYCKLFSDSFNNISSSNLSKLLIVSGLTDGSKIWPDPAGFTLTTGDSVYPIPAFIITTSVILPSDTIGLNLAPTPVPTPTRSISGGEKYSFPPNLTSTFVILPLLVNTLNSACLPFCKLMPGFFSKLSISDP